MAVRSAPCRLSTWRTEVGQANAPEQLYRPSAQYGQWHRQRYAILPSPLYILGTAGGTFFAERSLCLGKFFRNRFLYGKKRRPAQTLTTENRCGAGSTDLGPRAKTPPAAYRIEPWCLEPCSLCIPASYKDFSSLL